MEVVIYSVVFICTSLLFFFLGRWTRPIKFNTPDTLDSIVAKAREVKPKKKSILPGIIPFKTPEERENELSGDTALEQEWIRSGIAEKVTHDEHTQAR